MESLNWVLLPFTIITKGVFQGTSEI